MDWQILAALTISIVAIIAFLRMGYGRRDKTPTRAARPSREESISAPPVPSMAPMVGKADEDVIRRFAEALRNTR